MNQIAREAVPVWKISDAWKAVDKASLLTLSVGAALDYTNNKGFVVGVLVSSFDRDDFAPDLAMWSG